MNEEKFRFLELMGNIDDELIFQSCQPWQKRKRRVTFHPGKAAVCAILALALCLAGIFHEQVEAAIRNFTTKIAEMLGVSGNLEPYTEVIGVSQTKDGVTLTLEEVILAENQLYAAFHMEWDGSVAFEEGIESPSVSIADEPKINGEGITFISSGISNYDNGVDWGVTHDVLVFYVYDDDALPYDIHEIEMEARVYLTADDAEEGIAFPFHFSASKEELQKDTYSIPVDCEVQAGGGAVFRIHEFKSNKLFSRISADGNEAFMQEVGKNEYILLGKDSAGNPLRYEMAGGIGKDMIFESVGTLPSADCQWVELQLYGAKIPVAGRPVNSPDIPAAERGDVPEGSEDDDEIDEEESGLYSLDELDFAPVGGKLCLELPRLSESDVDSLVAEKGADGITWGDFEGFAGKDVGSGQYIYEYVLEEGARLYVAGNSLEEPPKSIYIIRRDGSRKEIKV